MAAVSGGNPQLTTNRSIAERFSATGPSAAVAGCGPERTLELGCFFDGTGNNRWRMSDASQSITNVVRLHDLYVTTPRANPPADRYKHYLIGVGAGTAAGQPNVGTGTVAAATGFGGKHRCNLMYRWVKEKIEAHCRIYAPNSRKLIDIFGFSRGALSARTFVNLVNQALKTEPGPAFQNIQVRFLGAFDTVESLAITDRATEAPNCHVRNSDYLGARHFTARHEIRKNFPLTLLDPGAQEVEYPGVHSDVGGGYSDNFQGKRNWISFVTLYDMRRACRSQQIEMSPANIPSGCDVTAQSPLRTSSDAEMRRLYVHQSHVDGWSIDGFVHAPRDGGREKIRRSRMTLSSRPPGYFWR